MDAAQKSSMVVPSATVVPLTSMIQNNAVKSGRARISQRSRTLGSPGRALVVGHVTAGASSDNHVVISTAINSLSRVTSTLKPVDQVQGRRHGFESGGGDKFCERSKQKNFLTPHFLASRGQNIA